ncbi:MAG: hypothetical protein KAT26_01740 [Marinosulfonomonas sp.]|nr:hypothetical protein [Marinosulfonomonas sp.]
MRLTILAFLALAACEVPVEPPLEEYVTTGCGATEYLDLIGQSADALAAAKIPEPKRIITPGMIVTQELNTKRLNVDVGKNNRIIRFWCG